MVVKKGYKQTEIGIIPTDWEVIKLGQNFNLKARIGWQGLTTKEYLESGDYSLITGTDFENGYINWDKCVFVEKVRFDQDKNIQVKIGDVLVTKDGTIGKVAYIKSIPNPTTLNSGVFVVRPITGKIDNRFFYYVLMSFYFDSYLNKITAGSTITHLYQKDFVHFSLILPPLPEQTAIANALSDMDALIAQTSTLIEKKKAIKQGVMQELLKPKEGWVTKKFDEVFEKIPAKNYQINSTKYKDSGEFPVIDQGKSKIIAYSDEALKVFNCPSKGLIVFGDHTRIFKYIDFNFIVGADGTQLLSTKNGFDTTLLYYILLTKEIPNTGYNRHFKFLKEMSFEVPDSEEKQKSISNILIDIDIQIVVSMNKLQKLKLQKQGMMQTLLTGKIRLV
jgi:type I restriction enzyme S subunit